MEPTIKEYIKTGETKTIFPKCQLCNELNTKNDLFLCWITDKEIFICTFCMIDNIESIETIKEVLNRG